ncbi:hypothetical protein P3T23_000048 [Paraburkholderia sp. GAS448]
MLRRRLASHTSCLIGAPVDDVVNRTVSDGRRSQNGRLFEDCRGHRMAAGTSISFSSKRTVPPGARRWIEQAAIKRFEPPSWKHDSEVACGLKRSG